MKRFCKIRFANLLILTVLLSGCAGKDPVEAVVDQHVGHVDEVLDYAYNNIEQTKDVKFLENELESCKLAMVDIKQTYYGQIATCKAKTDYWRLASISLFVALCLVILGIFKKIFI